MENSATMLVYFRESMRRRKAKGVTTSLARRLVES